MKQRFFTSESVTKGHPDKLCDQIADGILDALLAQDPASRVACEVTAEPGHIHIMGEITTQAQVDYQTVAREIIRRTGYTDDRLGLNADTCEITCSVHTQSPDIARGVDRAWEGRRGKAQGAGDQGMMFGFACSETEQLMPMPLVLAHELARRLTQVREDGVLAYLRPDGKTQVTVEYRQGRPARVEAVVVSAQHGEEVEMERLRGDIRREVIEKVIPRTLMDEETKLFINPTGRFVVGGPAGDAGLTGRKIIVDTYGGMARHGGGSFSGKDASKVDRSAAYMARYIAKNIVAADLAKQCEVQLSYAIGVAQPVQVTVDTAGTGTVEEELIEKLVCESFALTPAGIIETLQLTKPMYLPVAAYGHFGRDDLHLPWERTDKAQALAKKARAVQAAESQPAVMDI